jgi:VCBS repeat-containing protein
MANLSNTVIKSTRGIVDEALNTIQYSGFKANSAVTLNFYDSNTQQLIKAIVVQANAMGDINYITQEFINGEKVVAVGVNNQGIEIELTQVLRDYQAPSAPTALIDTLGSKVTGSAEPGSVIKIKNELNEVIATTVTDRFGQYSVLLIPPKIASEKLSVTASDTSPNHNESSPTLLTAPDLTPPPAPTNLAVVQVGSIVTGQAEANSKIEIRDPSGKIIGTGTTDSKGLFNVALTTAQKDSQLLTVNAIDAAGNKSVNAFVNAQDLTPPLAPTNLVVVQEGSAITGKAEANSTIQVKDISGKLIGVGITDSNGIFIVTLNPAQKNNENLTVNATDTSGNKSPNANVQAPDLTPPDLGTPSFNTTGTQISGTAEVNSKITVKDAAGKVIGTGVTGTDGTYVISLDKAYGAGEKVSITASDSFGNVSPPKVAIAPTLMHANNDVVHADIDLAYTTTSSKYTETKSFGSLIKLLGIPIFGSNVAEINFNVGATQKTNVDIKATNIGLESLFDGIRVTLYKQNDDGSWKAIACDQDWGLFNKFFLFFPEQARIQTQNNLEVGNYKVIAEDKTLLSILSSNSLNVTYTTTTQSANLEAVKANTVTGNVLANDDGVSNSLISKISNVDGKVADVSSTGSTTLLGKYGTLVIKADGSYSYTPNKDANNIGKVDIYTYTIKNTNGNISEAKIYVQIGSDEVSVNWNPNDPSKPGTLLKLYDDQDFAHLNIYKSTKIDTTSVASGDLLAGYKKVSTVVSNEFTIGNDKVDSTIKLSVKAGYDKGIFGSYSSYQSAGDTTFTWQLQKFNNLTNKWENVSGASGSKYFDLYTSSVKTGNELFGVEIPNITQPGQYRVNFNSSTGGYNFLFDQEFTTSVTVASKSVTDQWYADSYGKASGNIFNGVGVETAGTDKLGLGNKLAISTDGGVTFKDVSASGITVQGKSGALTIKSDGSYDYTQTSSSTNVENFLYKVTTNAGEVATAKLSIAYEGAVHGTVQSDTFISDSVLHVLELGKGADIVKFTALNTLDQGDIWSDFSKAEGDKIDVSSLLSGKGVTVSNISQYITVEQSGKDSIVKIDLDGKATQYTPKELVILENNITTLDELLKGNHILF